MFWYAKNVLPVFYLVIFFPECQVLYILLSTGKDYLKENETNWWFGVLQNLELIKKWKYDFFNENFTRVDVKARLYLIDFT